MALVLADRVRETTTTTGTGTVTLSGTAPTGYQTFSTAIGNANTTYYTINAGFQWEVGIGTYTTAGLTLSRDTVLSSSSGGALVDFAVGTKDVFVTYPAEKSVNYNASNNVGIGTTAPTRLLSVYDGDAAITKDTASAASSIIYMNKGRGSAGAPANISSGDNLGAVWFNGYSGSGNNNGYGYGAYVGGAADGAVSAGTVPGRLVFATTTSGDSSPTERLRITAAGNVGIGNTAPTSALDVTGQITTRGAVAAFVAVSRDGSGADWSLYNPTGDDFRIFGNSADRLTITNAGNVGIGTTAPQNGGSFSTVASIYGATSSALSIGNASRHYQWGIAASIGDALGLYDATFGNYRMVINTSGNVGIGTTAPAAKLDVNGNIYGVSVTATGGLAAFATGGGVTSFYSGGVGVIRAFSNGAGGASPLTFNASGSENMRLNANGNFAVGSTGYGNKLDVYLTSTQYALFGGGIGTGNGNYAGIALGYSEPGPIYQKSAIVQAQTGDGSARGTIHILNNGASSTANATLADARLSVTSDGNVGIGTTTPGRLLQVGGSGGYIKVAYIPGNYNFDGLYLSNATSNGGAKVEFIAHSTVDTSQSWKLQQDSDAAVAAFTFNYASPASTYAGLSYSEKMRITNAGNVGIGTSAPAYKLDVTGTISANGGMRPVFLVGSSVATSIFWDGAQFYPGVDGTILLGYPSWRWNTVYATTGTINTSDGNEKQDINLLNDAEKNVAVRLKSLVRSFKFNDAVAAKGAAARVHFGLIAQDVASAFEAEGLYPHRYAMFCSDTWYEVDGKPSTDVNDPFTKDTEGAVEKTRLGIRYDELIVFMISVL